ncbi:MAG: tryptophan synthase subunit alpha [Vampirovibrionia bacterium]
MNTLSIAQKIAQKNDKNKLAFIPFVVAGDPDIDKSKEIILALQKSGADIIELGIPYSDPLADGPVIQLAAQRALKAGTTLKKVIQLHDSIKDQLDVPVVIFTYYNPVLAYGLEQFITDIKKAGIKGVLVPDLPIEEAGKLIQLTKENGIELIMLVTPTSGDDRLKPITDASEGFVYLVSVTGVTGARSSFSESVESSLKKVKQFTDKPICVGFGISEIAHIKQLKDLNAQGAIVGSAIIKLIQQNVDAPEAIVPAVTSYVDSLVQACN